MKTFVEFCTMRHPVSEEETPVVPTQWHVRQYRLLRLQESDIAIIRYTEQGLAVPPEWLAYRQALRDITTTFPDPESVVFPDPPDVVIPSVVTSQEERLEAAELMIDLLLETQEGA
jgi:hypothetical protein